MSDHSTHPLARGLLLAALVLLGLTLRVHDLDSQSLWYDEAVTARVAQLGLDEMARWTADDIQPPLYYALTGGVTRLAGSGEWALRFPSLFFGVLMIPLAWVLGRRLFGWRAGLLAALLAALHPLWVYYSQEARMYTLLTALGMAAGYAMLRVLQEAWQHPDQPRRRILWWGVLVAASCALLYTHYFALFLLLAFALWFAIMLLARRGPLAGRLALEGVAAALIVLLAWLPWLPNALRRFGQDASYWQGALKLDEALRHIVISFTTGETVLEGQAIPLAWVVGIISVVCLVGLLVTSFRGRGSETRVRHSALLFVVLYLLIPIVAILALSYRTPKFNPRYLMLASPALVLLLAGGLALPFQAKLSGRPSAGLATLRAFSVAGLLLLLAIFALADSNWYNDPAFTKDDWRGAAAYVRANIQPDEAVVLVSGHALPAWRYYAPDLEPVRLPEIETLDVNAVLGDDTAGTLSAGLNGKAGAWLVQWQEEVVDPGGVVPFLLRQSGQEEGASASFWGLEQVRHFTLNPMQPLPTELMPDFPLDVNFGDQVTLLGVSQPRCPADDDGAPCPITLVWQAQRPLDSDLKLSATLFDGAGNTWSTPLDRRLSAYDYPTFRWQPGQTVLGQLEITPLPGTPPGSYDLRVGVYEGETGTAPLDRLDAAGTPAGRWATAPFRVDALTAADMPAPALGLPVAASPEISLSGATADKNRAAPGERLALDLWWQAVAEQPLDYEVRWEWLDPNNAAGSWGVLSTGDGGFATSRWPLEKPVRVQLLVPVPLEAQPGQWTLRVGLSRLGSRDQFAGATWELPVTVAGDARLFNAPPVEQRADAPVGDAVTLVGITADKEADAPGDSVAVTVVWQATEAVPASYTAFVHLLDGDGRVVAQDDHRPLMGERPTETWLPGEVIVDTHTLALPAELPPGLYRLEVGLYDANLPDLARPGPAVVLEGIEVR